ncbi:aconitase family protein, partial [Peptostreptococcus porci]|uniref:aconitase family protein n=1 Tax=Peptostreptococcus porci TaxID=2652282 RepID=UPI002A83AFBB
GIAIDENLPHIIDDNYKKAYDYMGLAPNDKITKIPIKHVFIGSCTNSRYSDIEKNYQAFLQKSR